MKLLLNAFLLGSVAGGSLGAVSARTSNADPLPPKARKVQETADCESGLNADPLFYLSAENGQKEFSPFSSCTDETIEGAATTTCDYSELLDMMQGPCELGDFQLYSVSLQHKCPAGSGGTGVTEKNLPVCIGATCDIEAVLVPRLLSRFANDCTGTTEQPTLSIEATRRNRTAVRGEACQQEMEVLTVDIDVIGNPGWVYTSEELLRQYCTDNNFSGGLSCDFTPIHATVAPLCTRQEGVLYHYSDVVTDGVYNISDGSVNTFYNPSTGVPVCLGKSCDPEAYFNELIAPYYNFSVAGGFAATVNGTRSSRVYQFDGFEQVASDGTGDGNAVENGSVSSTSTNSAAPVHRGLVFGSVVVMVQMMMAIV